MKYKIFLFGLILILAVEISVLVWFVDGDVDSLQDAVKVNEAVQSVQADWQKMENHKNITGLDYTVLDNSGQVIFQTRPDLSESIHEAVIHRDTILDIEIDGIASGKIIIDNDNLKTLENNRKRTAAVILFATIIQCAICLIYVLYLNRAVVKPFKKMKRFAESVAGGNLDIPLEMDRRNIFGAFTESFDIMRFELKRARMEKARAEASKKELIAKLSHDIRTPVASIKAASEVGAAIAENEKARQNYGQIIYKADQINTLVTNLFSATLEELEQLAVEPVDMESGELSAMLKSADYFHYARIPSVPECLIFADKLRLQQVFDNIFANSYKYADTKIDVEIGLKDDRLWVKIEDYGGGVSEKEISGLKEKFRRGGNAENIEGAGLGLYISDCFMKEMKGGLLVENGQKGLSVTVSIALSGTI